MTADLLVDGLVVEPGPGLLADLDDGPGLLAHRGRFGPSPRPEAAALVLAAEAMRLRGRGGAAFPFAVKARTVLAQPRRRRPVVVLNLSEGEPLSAKDQALALVRPHLVLDGALAAAHAIGAREVHVVLPGERPGVARAMVAALAERRDAAAVRWHVAAPRFVSGQSQAVVELVSGRENLPVTTWQPTAVSGVRGRPTLLSNAETFAHLALALHRGVEDSRRRGTDTEPGTTLLTVTTPDRPARVREAAYGATVGTAVPELRAAGAELVLLGGFHGTWVRRDVLARAPLSVDGLSAIGAPLGAGVVHLPPADDCPVARTAAIVEYLAQESAGRCGPCRFGLPELAVAVQRLAAGSADASEAERLSALVSGRGACAHPDGTVRLLRSLLTAAGDEVETHARGGCGVPDRTRPVRPGGRVRS